MPSQNDTQAEAQTRCDEHGDGKTNSEEQLNGSTHDVLPGMNARWLGEESAQNDSVTLPGCSSAANSAKQGRRYSLTHKWENLSGGAGTEGPHNHSGGRNNSEGLYNIQEILY